MDKSQPYWVGFAVSSASPALAAVLTNPIEVVKVRQQQAGLQNGQGAGRAGVAHLFREIYRTQGVAGLQSGLRLAMFREASKSFFRVGCFRPILDIYHDNSQGPAPIPKRMAAGMTSGAVAALVCNPIELVKTRQQGQVQSSGYSYKGPVDGVRQLYAEAGVAGMWRGTQVSMLRSASVTGPHLTTYSSIKDKFLEEGWLDNSPPLHVLSSLCGGFAGVCCNHPFDTIRNRLYNQKAAVASGGGVQYDGAFDCARQVMRAEGFGGFYRGFAAHYLRVGPHYVLTFTILEQLQQLLRQP